MLFQQHREAIAEELAIEDTAEYKDMMRMSHSDFQRILSYIKQDITRKQVLGGNKVSFSERKISPDNQIFGHWRNIQISELPI